MDDHPSFGEIVAFAASGAALGGAANAATIILVGAWAGPTQILLGLFLAMAVGIIAAMFTAFPFGFMIAVPVFRLFGRSAATAASVGLACAALLWWLWGGWDPYNWADYGWEYAAIFHGIGPASGWVAHRLSFPFMAWPDRA